MYDTEAMESKLRAALQDIRDGKGDPKEVAKAALAADYPRIGGAEAGKRMARGIMDALNTLSNEDEVIKGFCTEAVHYTHRTLQQGFGRLLVELVKMWAGKAKEGNFDLRNESLVKLCAKMVPVIEQETNGGRLPLI
jgi:hypothetical protein